MWFIEKHRKRNNPIFSDNDEVSKISLMWPCVFCHSWLLTLTSKAKVATISLNGYLCVWTTWLTRENWAGCLEWSKALPVDRHTHTRSAAISAPTPTCWMTLAVRMRITHDAFKIASWRSLTLCSSGFDRGCSVLVYQVRQGWESLSSDDINFKGQIGGCLGLFSQKEVPFTLSSGLYLQVFN